MSEKEQNDFIHEEINEEYLDEPQVDHAAEKKKKKDKIFKIAVIGVAVLVAGGLIAGRFLNTKKPAPVVKQQQKPQEQMAQAPKVDEPLNSAVNVTTPGANVGMNSSSINVTTPGANVGMNSGGINVTTPGANVGMNSGGINVTTPGANVGMNSGAVNVTTPNAQVAMNNDTSQQQPVMTSTSNDKPNSKPNQDAALISQEKLSGFERGLDELVKKVGNLAVILENVEKLNVGDRLEKIEAKLSALESSTANKHSSSADAKEVKKTTKHVYNNSNSSQQTASVAASVATHQGVKMKVYLQAVIPGRMWVKFEDGKSENYAVGEILPDGSKILKIDADKFKVTTSRGIIN